MSKEKIEEAVRQTLSKGGYLVSSRYDLRSFVFDIIGRKDSQLLLVKVFTNIDAMNRDFASTMKQISDVLGASCLIVGRRSGSGDLENGVVYNRMGVPAITLETLDEFILEGVPPFIFAAPGGFYVKIDSEALRMARDEKNISLGTLAEKAGVSRRTISMYMEGMGAMIDVALRLEDFLNSPIVEPLNPLDMENEMEEGTATFNDRSNFENIVFGNLFSLGFDVLPVAKCPFEAVTSDEKVLLLTGLEENRARLKKKARVFYSFSTVAEKDSVIFVQKSRRDVIEGIPVMTPQDLECIDDPADFEEKIKRKKRYKEL